MNKIEQAVRITNGLLSHGVSEWESAEKHDPGDWKYVDTIRSVKGFVYPLLDEVDQTESALIICRKFIQDVIETFEGLIYKWDERELEEVPNVVSGIEKAKQWLEEGK